MRGARVLQVNVSAGGVPKLPVPSARITRTGVEGDRQRETTVHGGPHRAVSLLGIEAISRVAAEGHPIGPGTTGENLTVTGLDVSLLPYGTRLHVGEALVLEISQRTDPCRTIRGSFRDGRFSRLSALAHPADSRMYARVLVEGTVHAGDPIRVEAPVDDDAERHVLARRLDRADRASSLAIWEAATEAGAVLEILDDGEIAVAASPSLPSPVFNLALGFAHLPNLVPVAVDHFAAAGVTGWLWGEEDPWPDAIVDARAALFGAAIEAVVDAPRPPGVTIRELGRDEVGSWGSVIAAAAELPPPVDRAWKALETPLAANAHHHRFVAELDGRPVAAASLHTYHGAGWLRAASVVPEARGRGIQRALVATRAARAGDLGCDVVGSLADTGGASAANLARMGLAVVAERRRYRVEPADRIA